MLRLLHLPRRILPSRLSRRPLCRCPLKMPPMTSPRNLVRALKKERSAIHRPRAVLQTKPKPWSRPLKALVKLPKSGPKALRQMQSQMLLQSSQSRPQHRLALSLIK